MALATGLIIDDFERLSDEEAHNKELVDEELIDVPGNIWDHNRKLGYLYRSLHPVAEESGLGTVIIEQEFDFGGNAHTPDLAFVHRDRKHLIANRRVQRFVPDLAIEIVSPNDKFNDVAATANRYRQFGTSEVWVFLIETREAYVYSDTRNVILKDYPYFEPPVIPGFRLALSEFFDSK